MENPIEIEFKPDRLPIKKLDVSLANGIMNLVKSKVTGLVKDKLGIDFE
jgi:hypothetical protein